MFKGSLRSPGDRGPGIRALPEVDEYHLQIRRGPDLMGRWYLAEVEVVRDVAERFKLFLGDDEMEFLADDASYSPARASPGCSRDGSTPRRRNGATGEQRRRPPGERTRHQTKNRRYRCRPWPSRLPAGGPAAKAPSSELAKKLAAIAAAEEAGLRTSGVRSSRFSWAEEESAELAPRGDLESDWVTAREEMAIRQEEVDTPPPIEALANPVEEPVKPSATSRMRRRSSPAPETPSPRLERAAALEA